MADRVGRDRIKGLSGRIGNQIKVILEMVMSWMRLAFSGPVWRRALKVAVLVGSILVAVNQGGVILQGEFDVICLLKIGLTFMVPYFVSTFSSVAALQDCSTDNV